MTNLVEVTWEDICTYSDNKWRKREFVVDDLTPTNVKTVGYIVKSTKKFLVLASTVSEFDDTLHTIVIPRGTVLSVKKLKYTR